MMFHSSMPRIFALILAGALLLVASLRADAAPKMFQPIAVYDFAAGRPSIWTGTWCEWKSYGGSGDGASLLMLGGDACLAGPYQKTSIYQVQVLWSGYFVGGGGGGQYRVVILNSQYQLVQMSGTIEQSGGFSLQFPQSVGLESFYVLFEHVSGVSVHLDDVQIGWATQAATATPAPTSTPGATATGTPAPTSTPAPTPTPTPTPDPTENVDSGYKCGGRGWFNWLLCWIVPPKDVFSSLQKLWDWLFNKDPFVTVKRLADMRQAMISAIQSGGDVADISGWAAMVQRGFVWFFYDVLGQWRVIIQALFDAMAAIGFWRYVTLRLSI